MTIWAVTATLVAIVTIIMFLSYRRQVKKTCRQLAFIKEHETNLRLCHSLPFSELDELTEEINGILDFSKKVLKEAEKNENALKVTITSLSHDIRTPLTSLDGYFQLLATSTSEEERVHYTQIIKTRITSLKDILEELFTYTKLQNDSYELALSQVDLGKNVFDTLFSFYDDFQRRGIEPETDFTEERVVIQGNNEALRRTLQNVIKNSLEHGKSKIALSLTKQDDRVVFRCSNDIDNPAEIDMSRIFTRFYKADSARTHTSTGLGLSIAKELVERMGGTINAELSGNTFTVVISFPII